MSEEKSLVVRRSINRETEFESVLRRSRFSERLRLRRVQRNNSNGEQNQRNNSINSIDDMELVSSTNDIIGNSTNNTNTPNNNNNSTSLSSTSLDDPTNTNPLIELLSDSDFTEHTNEDIHNEDRNINENPTADRTESESTLNINDNEDIDPANSITQRDLISPINLNNSIIGRRHQNIVENVTESNTHIDRASNFLELAQVQNRWILFGLGAGFILITGLSYWFGYRAGRSSILISENSSTINQRKKGLKMIWNLLIEQFKR